MTRFLPILALVLGSSLMQAGKQPEPPPAPPRLGPVAAQVGIEAVFAPGHPALPMPMEPPPFTLDAEESTDLPGYFKASEFIPMTEPLRLTCPNGSIRQLTLEPEGENPRDYTYVHASHSPGQVFILNLNGRTEFTYYPGETLSIYLDSPSVRKVYNVYSGKGGKETIEVFFAPSREEDRWEGVLLAGA